MVVVARELARLAAGSALRLSSRLLAKVADIVDAPEPEEPIGVPVNDLELEGDPLRGARTMLAPPPRSETMPSPSYEEAPLVGSLEARGLAGDKKARPW